MSLAAGDQATVPAAVEWLEPDQLIALLDELPQRPMLAQRDGLRLSLAGAQDKLPVVFDGRRIGLPRGDAASTHILKPAIAAVEARGFLFATPMAIELGVGVIPVRKPGKLPADTITYEYELEYGRDRLEMHRGILPGGARVLIVDDVLATGGTAQACGRLIEAGGATVAGAAFLVELTFLGGRERLAPHRIESLLSY